VANSDEELILEQLAHNRAFLTDADLSNLRRSFVIISVEEPTFSALHATTVLARSEVARIRDIDFDQVALSETEEAGCCRYIGGCGNVPRQTGHEEEGGADCAMAHVDCRNELFSSQACPRQ
jgi:hypothetical protein